MEWRGHRVQATDDMPGLDEHLDAAAALICDGKVIAAIEEGAAPTG